MSDTITDGTTTITPALILAHESASTSTTKVHQLLSGGRAYRVGGDTSRDGRLECIFTSAADAHDARDFFAQDGKTFTRTNTDTTELSMEFVRVGQMSIQLNQQTLKHWHLVVGYSEVAA